MPGILASAPSTYGHPFTAENDKHSEKTQVIGTTPSYFAIGNWAVGDGKLFTVEDIQQSTRVAVLGSSIASKLFPEETGSDITLTGRTLRINRIPFTVIGVLAPKGYGINGYNQDDVILMPITTARSRLWESAFANTIVTMIIIKADAGVNLDYVGQDVLELLQQHHKMPDTTSFQSTA